MRGDEDGRTIIISVVRVGGADDAVVVYSADGVLF